jgi:hypothetical protein
MKWSNNLSFIPEHFFILKRDILPYFEEIEDYELCNRILKLHKEIIESKKIDINLKNNKILID